MKDSSRSVVSRRGRIGEGYRIVSTRVNRLAEISSPRAGLPDKGIRVRQDIVILLISCLTVFTHFWSYIEQRQSITVRIERTRGSSQPKLILDIVHIHPCAN